MHQLSAHCKTPTWRDFSIKRPLEMKINLEPKQHLLHAKNVMIVSLRASGTSTASNLSIIPTIQRG